MVIIHIKHVFVNELLPLGFLMLQFHNYYKINKYFYFKKFSYLAHLHTRTKQLIINNLNLNTNSINITLLNYFFYYTLKLIVILAFFLQNLE